MNSRITQFGSHIAAIIARISAVSRMAMLVTLVVLATFVSPLLGIILAVVMLWRLNKAPRQSGTSHGTARWASVDDLLHAGCLFSSGVPIGRTLVLRPVSRVTVTKALLLSPLSRSREAVALAASVSARPQRLPLCIPSGKYPHTAIFGASGSGKSSCYSVPVLLECGDNMVVLDPKGELARMTAGHRRKKFGHDVRIIDPYGTTDGCGFDRDRLNPLSLFRDDESRIVDEARRMATALIETTGHETDKFWPKSSAALLTGVLAFLIAEARAEEASLNTLRDILTNPALMDDVLKHMQQSDACGGLLRRLSGQLGQLQGQTRASVYSVANSHIDFLDSLPIADTLAESTFDARRLIHGRQTIYLCLPVDRLSELVGLQRVLLSTLINLVFAAGEDRGRRVRFLLDEAATLGSMDSLYAAVQFGRSFGLNLTFLFQSTSQVTRCFPESQKESFHATVASVFCGINDLQTAKEVSDWIGQTTVEGRTTQVGWNTGESTSTEFTGQPRSTNRGSSDSTSYAETARLLMRPEEVLQLPGNAAVALIPGVRPILAEKVSWFRRRRTGVIGRVIATGWHLTFAACCIAVITGAVWLMTSGQNHPQVIALKEQVRRELQPTQSAGFTAPSRGGYPVRSAPVQRRRRPGWH